MNDVYGSEVAAGNLQRDPFFSGGAIHQARVQASLENWVIKEVFGGKKKIIFTRGKSYSVQKFNSPRFCPRVINNFFEKLIPRLMFRSSKHKQSQWLAGTVVPTKPGFESRSVLSLLLDTLKKLKNRSVLEVKILQIQ